MRRSTGHLAIHGRALIVGVAAALVFTACGSPQAGLGDSVPTPGAPTGEGEFADSPLIATQDTNTSCADVTISADSPPADSPPADAPPADAPAGSKSLPSLSLPCLDGSGDVDTAALRGPLVMTIWASWCVPCRRELPAFAAVHARAEASDAPVRFLGLNWLDDSASAVGFADELGIGFPSLFDADGIARGPLGVNAQPATLFIDSDGRIVHIERRPIDKIDDLTNLIRTHLAVEVPA
jgi:cytochrome c biogenesis protein CcmG, thiol:disulfide interchange protein DsbE